MVKEQLEIIEAVCYSCRHLLQEGTCLAFPDGIPEDILSGVDDHRSPSFGQKNNLVFKGRLGGEIEEKRKK